MRKFLLALLILTLMVTPVAAQDDDSITLIPFRDNAFEISGVVPDGWNEVAPGVLSRGDEASAGNLAQIVQQAAALPPDALLEALLPQLGVAEVPPVVGERGTGTLSWTLYQAEVSEPFAATMDFALAESGGRTFLVLMVSDPDEYDSLHESLFLPVVDALAPLSDETPPDYHTEEVRIENGEVTLAWNALPTAR